MSLRIHLPLDGDINNYGLSAPIFTQYSVGYSTGKVTSRAMSAGSIHIDADTTSTILNNNSFSYACWIYVNADTGSDIGVSAFFGKESMGAYDNRKFTLFQYPNVNSLHWSWMNDAEGEVFSSEFLSDVFPSYQWTHLAVTYENPVVKIYINGQLLGTFSGISNSSSFNYTLPIVVASPSRILNDVRIYDHCISAKEIRELAKGLVLHYPLNNQFETSLRNLYSGETSKGLASNATRKNSDGSYKYIIDHVGDGGNAWSFVQFPTFSFTPGKDYLYSIKIRINEMTTAGAGLAFRAARWVNDWNMGIEGMYSTTNGEWKELTYVLKNIQSSYENPTAPLIEFCTDSLFVDGFHYYMDFDLKDAMICEIDHYIPFIENSMCTDIVSDCSGYGNNGIKNGFVSTTNNSPRYDVATSLQTDSNIVFNKSLSFLTTCSISFWVKVKQPGQGGWLPFAGQGSSTYVMASSNWTGNFYNGEKVTPSMDIARTYVDGNPANAPINDSNWHHYCITGVNLSQWDCFKINSYTDAYHWNANCNMSDVRVYNTILSDLDIKELYQTSASIDSQGNVYCAEIKEV